MEKDEWKYVFEIRFDTESVWTFGYDMYFSILDQAVKRFIEINFQALIGNAVYYPFTGNQLKSVTLKDIQVGKIMLETEMKKWRPNWEEFDEKAPGLYIKFPQGVKDFEKKSGLDLKHFKPEDNTILIGYYVGDRLKSSKPVIAFEDLYRKMQMEADDVFTVDYELSGFGNGITRTRDIVHQILVEEYYFLTAEDALKKLLSTNFNMLDDSVAWEQGHDYFYESVKCSKVRTTIAQIQSARAGTLEVGSYLAQEPGIFLILQHEDLEDQLAMLNGAEIKPWLYQLGKYNERRDGVIVSDEIVMYLAQHKKSNVALNAKKGLQKTRLKGTTPKGRGNKL